MKNLQQKVAVVTGAASGIGRQLCIQLAAAGATVALADVQEERLYATFEMIWRAGGKASMHLLDVSKKEQVHGLAEEVIRQHRHVDIVINNAGVALGLISVEELSYEEMEWLPGINLWGVIYGTKAFLPHLKKRPEAALVNISSVFGLSGIPLQAAYCTAKFGVRGFTKTLRAGNYLPPCAKRHIKGEMYYLASPLPPPKEGVTSRLMSRHPLLWRGKGGG